jgi:spermidine synthase
MKIKIAIIIACVVGFVSISMEIIWFSIVGFLFQGHAGIFGIVLSLILFGIALGARFVHKRIKNYDQEQVIKLISNALLLGGIINFAGLPLTAWLMTFHIAFGALIFVNIVAISALLGCIFPMLCQLTVSSTEQKVGQQTSWIYAANIIGATSGPLITGYVLIDHFSMQTIITAFCIIPILLSLLLRIPGFKAKHAGKYIFAASLLIILALFGHGLLYNRFLEEIHFNTAYTKDRKFEYIVQNKNGIITVEKTPKGDVFYGGGAYDGAINTNLLNPVNIISRAYMVAALHPSPRRALMIGLSTGSWAKVLTDFSKIEELVIIEINPGYLELIQKFPEVSDILHNKKVRIIIDDGRRWLKMNEQEKFDLIVMNTTFHWREHSTNLLSKEFLLLCKNCLNPNGVMYWNTTASPVVINTACHVFNYVTTYVNFVAASDGPFNMTTEEKKKAFLEFIRNGQPVFKQNDSTLALLDKYSNTPLPNVRDSFLRKNLWVITDNNMATEYKSRYYKK